jgi:glycosyltransferase involved in cell wall biosynthesis
MLPLVDQRQITVDVAYVLPWKDNYHAALESAGADVHCLGASSPNDPRWVWRLGRLLRDGRYDLVHTHAPVPATAVRILTALGRNRPAIVHTEHNLWDRYRWPTRVLNSATYHRNRAAIAVSDTVARSIRPWLTSRSPSVVTVHHGTVLDSVRSWPADEVRKRRCSLGLPEDQFLVGNVGNFTAKKDHSNLLMAMAGDTAIADAHLVLIGLGPLEDELRRTAAELGIAERTTFLGSRDDVFEILPLLDLFCLSSQFEGFPIALVEAMATGLACVATSVGGIPEIVTDGANGVLVPPRDHEALRRAVEAIMADPDRAQRYGKAARATAEGLDLRNAVETMEGIYRAALRGGR